MDANDLRIVDAVARAGSMNKAAAELNMVQSNCHRSNSPLASHSNSLRRPCIALENASFPQRENHRVATGFYPSLRFSTQPDINKNRPISGDLSEL
jgi:hypothetical protein